MASWQEEIRQGQSFWTEDCGNGYIYSVDWAEREVHVRYHNSNKIRTYEFDEVLGSWDERLQQWVVVST